MLLRTVQHYQELLLGLIQTLQYMAKAQISTVDILVQYSTERGCSDHARLDDAATFSNVRVAASLVETSRIVDLRVADDHVPETARRERARCH